MSDEVLVKPDRGRITMRGQCAGCTGAAQAREGRERPMCRMHRCRAGQGRPRAANVQDAPVPRRPGMAESGRVGALIELGAGFNPILTARENIYVNGSVLGCSDLP